MAARPSNRVSDATTRFKDEHSASKQSSDARSCVSYIISQLVDESNGS